MPERTTKDVGQAFVAPVIPALQTGVVTGFGGFLLGGGAGILRSAHPGLAAIFTGAQFFTLGSSFLYTREVLLKTAFTEQTRKSESASSFVAGAVAGAAAGAFYGRMNAAVGIVCVGTVGYLGQKYIHGRADSDPVERDRRPILDRVAGSRWLPFQNLSNDEYERLLIEKRLKVDAEISLIDEKLAILRSNQHGTDTKPTTT